MNPQMDTQKDVVDPNTDQFKENMPKVEHNAKGEEKRQKWKQKFSRIIGIFHSGGTYKRSVEGAQAVSCIIRNIKSKRVMTEAKGTRYGKWSAAGNAKRAALHKLKKKLGQRFDGTKCEFEYKVI